MLPLQYFSHSINDGLSLKRGQDSVLNLHFTTLHFLHQTLLKSAAHNEYLDLTVELQWSEKPRKLKK